MEFNVYGSGSWAGGSYLSEIIVNQCLFANMCNILKKKYNSYFCLKHYQLQLVAKHYKQLEHQWIADRRTRE